MNPLDQVRILPPFSDAFPGVFSIREIVGTTAFLDGIPEGFSDAFDLCFLELVP